MTVTERKSGHRWSVFRYLRWAALSRTIILTFLLGILSLTVLGWWMSAQNESGDGLTVENADYNVIDDDADEELEPVALSEPYSSVTSLPQLKYDPKVLVFVETQYSPTGRDIIAVLEATRRKFRVELGAKSIPELTRDDKGKFGLIVFENVDRYFRMDHWNRELLDRYCREYHVGIIGFPPIVERTIMASSVSNMHLQFLNFVQLQNFQVNASNPILHIIKAGNTWKEIVPAENWTIFLPAHATYESIAFAELKENAVHLESRSFPHKKLTTAILDTGKLDGVQRVFLGQTLKFWMVKILFLDAMAYLTNGYLQMSLMRYMMIDIDDIFVGQRGIRIKAEDADALVETMEQWRQNISGFRFNLGFSGKYFHAGSEEENKGDDRILTHAKKLRWFCHMWGHSQPHIFNTSADVIIREMQLNHHFAKEHNIPTESGYVISPHHSGVYPVHEPLYEAWRTVWNAQVTSTEEYPHFKPMHTHRGFIHNGIRVLPRQTCGLFTHTLWLEKYPGGKERLERNIYGGDLFMTFVYNPINVYMTHMSNYGSDRLALYTFNRLFDFIRSWTNLKIRSGSPIRIADLYFRMYPQDRDPVWHNPCNDRRHKEIWALSKSCERLPKFLVVGPQKTGTTALYTFLSLHPAIASSYKNPETFEEIQFFSSGSYLKGLDWYMNFFPIPDNASTFFMFEKSASYFDNEIVPLRAFALLPRASIISTLTDPIRRAYSWYHHVRSHGDPMAMQFTFLEVLMASNNSSRALLSLRSRCLRPGEYVVHLERWLDYYPSTQLLILDGDEIKSDPVSVLHKVQRFLKIKPFIDYSDLIRYDSKKGYYCQIISDNRNRCLGRSKGHNYEPMDPNATKFLRKYYQPFNVALHRLLTRLNQPVPLPKWLQADLL